MKKAFYLLLQQLGKKRVRGILDERVVLDKREARIAGRYLNVVGKDLTNG